MTAPLTLPSPLDGWAIVRRAVGRAVGLAGWACLAGAVALALVVGIGPHTGRYRTLTVLSGSMAPLIGAGDIVVAVPKPLTEVRVGDVLVYQAPIDGRPVVTHRVVEIVEGGDRPIVRTKGDANDTPDAWTARLGGGPAWEVRGVVPAAGHLVQLVRSSVLRWLLVIGAPAGLLALWLLQIWRPSPSGEDRAP